jgi:hypothetical protein
MTYDLGAYSLIVPHGDYFLYIESIDRDPNGGNSNRWYFDNIYAVPNYASIVPGWGGCVGPVGSSTIQTEFFNQGDASMETQCNATKLTLTNTTAPGTNFVASLLPNMLGVGRVTASGGSPPYYSPRGIRVSFPSTSASLDVEYKILGGALYSNGTYNLRFSPTRTVALTGSGEANQIPSGGSIAGIPTNVSGTLNVLGNATVRVTLSSPSLYYTIFAQADVTPQSGTSGITAYSNAPVVWMRN